MIQLQPIQEDLFAHGTIVWGEKNLNGVQDKGEPGVIGVGVTLLDGSGNIAKDVHGNPVKLTKTDNKGYYKFCHLTPAQDYQIKFTLPKGYLTTLKDKGSDLKDSDAKSDGVIYVTNPVVDDMSFDVGIYCECDDYTVHPEKFSSNDSAPALSIFGGLLAILTLGGLAMSRRDEEA